MKRNCGVFLIHKIKTIFEAFWRNISMSLNHLFLKSGIIKTNIIYVGKHNLYGMIPSVTTNNGSTTNRTVIAKSDTYLREHPADGDSGTTTR